MSRKKHTNALSDILSLHGDADVGSIRQINLAEEPCPDSDEALTSQKKCKKRLITKRERKSLENGVTLILQLSREYI